MEISLFLIGWLFGACCGVAIMLCRRTGIEIGERQKIIEQLEIRDRLIAQQRETIKNLKRGKE